MASFRHGFAGLVSVALASLACAAAAQTPDGHCSGAAFGDQVGVARVVRSRAKVNFVRGVHDNKACPSASDACREKSFLVAGDEVLTTERNGDFVCANFANTKGVETIGWLPAAALEPITPAPLAVPSGWTGKWRRIEATIDIKPSAGGALAVDGEATWGSYDPERVKRGAVQSGNISGLVKPADDALFITDGPGKTFDKAPSDACSVRMRRVGRYLLVEDNKACGGVNVSFSGLYVKR